MFTLMDVSSHGGAEDDVPTAQDRGAADGCAHLKVRFVLICVRALSHSLA